MKMQYFHCLYSKKVNSSRNSVNRSTCYRGVHTIVRQLTSSEQLLNKQKNETSADRYKLSWWSMEKPWFQEASKN